jgi:hypothetical protein
MNTHDSSDEYLRIAQRYRQMSDEELLVLVPQTDELTPFAQQALASEVRQRGLKLEAAPLARDRADVFARRMRFEPGLESKVRSDRQAPRFRESVDGDRPGETDSDFRGGDSTDGDSFDNEAADDSGSAYTEDRKLVDLLIVYSERDGLRMQALLDDAGIPSFIGPEKATGVDEVTSDFSPGLDVKVMQIGRTWAATALHNRYFPEDAPKTEQDDENEETPVRCPKCHSEEVVFMGGDSPEMSGTRLEKFKWVCDACGKEWEDDGVVEGG